MASTSSSSTATDQELTSKLQQLRSQLNKKQTFESAVTSIKSLLISHYPSSSPSTQSLFYDVVCRVSTVLRTRYTAPGFLLAGCDLLSVAATLTPDPARKSDLYSLLSALQPETEPETNTRGGGGGGGYLFEGHLTVDPEPAQPNWLVRDNLITALGSGVGAGELNVQSLLEGLAETMMMEEGMDFPVERNGAPPASKAVVEGLPVVKVDEGMLKKVAEECHICKEEVGVGDEMMELPSCKHMFHPSCLKPWFKERNSCPVCRDELPTDDYKYEREKELEEERKGAANAVRGGEFMYI